MTDPRHTHARGQGLSRIHRPAFVLTAALVALVLSTSVAEARCEIRVRILQTGAHAVSFTNTGGRVRSRVLNNTDPAIPGFGLRVWGLWANMYGNTSFMDGRPGEEIHLPPRRSIAGTYTTILECEPDREFNLTYRCRGGIYAATNYTFGVTVFLPGSRDPTHPRELQLHIGAACR